MVYNFIIFASENVPKLSSDVFTFGIVSSFSQLCVTYLYHCLLTSANTNFESPSLLYWIRKCLVSQSREQKCPENIWLEVPACVTFANTSILDGINLKSLTAQDLHLKLQVAIKCCLNENDIRWKVCWNISNDRVQCSRCQQQPRSSIPSYHCSLGCIRTPLMLTVRQIVFDSETQGSNRGREWIKTRTTQY
jgi:hypothetical protein